MLSSAGRAKHKGNKEKRDRMVQWAFQLSLLLLLSPVDCALASQLFSLPSVYTGATPYQGLYFDSTNVTIPLRTQRDLLVRNVTIDRGLWPALSLSSYFGTDFSAQKLSDVEQVLWMGYSRIILDLYWDAGNTQWQLCPFSIPVQQSSSSSNTTDDVQLGKYKCAPWYTFHHFMDAVNQFLTSTDLGTSPSDTNILFLILNLHEVNTSSSSGSASSLPVNTPSAFIANSTTPSTSSGSSSVARDTVTGLHAIISSAVISSDRDAPRYYTPQNLSNDRQNLTFHASNSTDSTTHPNLPWPNWLDLVKQGVQLLVGFGENTLPDHAYDTSQDADTIFNSTDLRTGWYMHTAANLTQLSSPDCALPRNTSLENTTYASPYDPWPYLRDTRSAPFTYNTIQKAVNCGYSPFFTASNYTASNATFAVNDTAHWADNVLGSIWTWDVSEPKMGTNPRCAMMQEWNGRWRAGDCTTLLRVACRHVNDTSKWVLTGTYVSYERAFAACPDQYVFDTPRIAIENQQLYQVIQQDRAIDLTDTDRDELLHRLFWINLNSGTDGSCWVVGLNESCWWLNNVGQRYQRLVKTSAIAGVIILILVGIFAWVKCARWWRNRKAQIRKHFIKDLLARREYVTVPA
ncbi:hypothetical protein BCR43DRAFT_526188 [Syncephalastrum racemosum]|uniref:Maintenance of telomere capping protein 6 n=1 Tax=Syncephalastrum racemosum TaxID=13706 RepID=A0A1X2H5I5_SYNRA|nr:hypothetical protein BCR43DRAFT_526188 [Syncephalastrum racemosum]